METTGKNGNPPFPPPSRTLRAQLKCSVLQQEPRPTIMGFSKNTTTRLRIQGLFSFVLIPHSVL